VIEDTNSFFKTQTSRETFVAALNILGVYCHQRSN
jgi:hypothetical protein